MLLGVDVGGTFTDAALLGDGRLITAKAPTTVPDQSQGVLDAVEAALAEAGRDASDVERFVHGMTVGTNALLEGNVATTALLATRGFTDIEELRRQARPRLYDLCAGHPPPLVPPERRIAVAERTGPDGVLEELDAGALERAVEAMPDDVEEADAAARHGSWTVLSGPAGGAVGAARVAGAAGHPDAVCLDMGGTSCDVSLSRGAGAATTGGSEVGGRPLALPMVDVHTVGAGGGSVAWRDAGGALRVGPRSSGADPGPACYGRGGSEPTVTDANLLLGYLDAGSPLAGVALDREAAERAVRSLADALGLDVEGTASGIVRVAGVE